MSLRRIAFGINVISFPRRKRRESMGIKQPLIVVKH
jgi:hypothetical protein